VTYWPKITNFSHPSHLAPSFGVTLFEFMKKLYGSWNQSLPVSRKWRFGVWRTGKRTDRIAMAKTRWKQ